jgi:hypothetical protein
MLLDESEKFQMSFQKYLSIKWWYSCLCMYICICIHMCMYTYVYVYWMDSEKEWLKIIKNCHELRAETIRLIQMSFQKYFTIKWWYSCLYMCICILDEFRERVASVNLVKLWYNNTNNNKLNTRKLTWNQCLN